MSSDRTHLEPGSGAGPEPIRRRGWLVVGGLAACAGLGWKLWSERGRGDELPPEVWQTQLRQLDGTDVPLERWRGRPLVVNFWATWCAPCLREMPALDRFHQRQAAAGWTVLGVAVDREEAVREFLKKRSVSYPIALATASGLELSRQLGNPQGGLPFSAIIAASGRVAHRKLGEANDQEIASWPERAASGTK